MPILSPKWLEFDELADTWGESIPSPSSILDDLAGLLRVSKYLALVQWRLELDDLLLGESIPSPGPKATGGVGRPS